MRVKESQRLLLKSKLQELYDFPKKEIDLNKWFIQTDSIVRQVENKTNISNFHQLIADYKMEVAIWRYSLEYVTKIYTKKARDFLIDLVRK